MRGGWWTSAFQGWEFKLFTCAHVEWLLFCQVIPQRAMTQTLCLPSRHIDFCLGRCRGNRLFSHGFVLSSTPASDWSQNSRTTAQHGMNFTQGFFIFFFPASSCSPTIFHRDNISHWTGNLYLKIPNDMSCSEEAFLCLKCGQLCSLNEGFMPFFFGEHFTDITGWFNTCCRAQKKIFFFFFMATRCQSTVMWEYPMRTIEPTAATEAEPDFSAQQKD